MESVRFRALSSGATAMAQEGLARPVVPIEGDRGLPKSPPKPCVCRGEAGPWQSDEIHGARDTAP